MLTKNLTPFPIGTKVCSRRPPAPELTLVVKGTFAIVDGGVATPIEDQPPLTAETFADDDEARGGECLYPGDFADFKPNGEVLLHGTCHSPGGAPVRECPVRVTVGEWSKALRVVGWRAWSDGLAGAALSAPVPFSEMSLGFEYAFGGPGHASNPVGLGLDTPTAPAVEAIGEPIRSRRDRPEPASFAPVNPSWPQRRAKVGTRYGGDYARTRAPYYAADFDWSYFSAGLPDQQLPGYLRGDEEVTLENLRRGAPRLTTRLPGDRLRAFVRDDEGRFREVAMRLDTLFLEPDLDRLTLVWRGVDAVREDDLEDVVALLVASEPLGSEPLPVDHYRAELDAFEADPIGLADAFPPGLIDLAARIEAERQGAPEPEDAAIASMDPLSAKLARAFGPFAAEEQALARAAMARVLAFDPPADPVVRAEIAKARGSDGLDPRADLAAAVGALEDSPPRAVSNKPGGLPSLGLRKQMRALIAQADAAEAGLDEAEAKVSEARAQLVARGEEVPPEASAREAAAPEARAGIATLRKVPEDPRWADLDPGYTYPLPLSTGDPGPGADLTDRDLSGCDLRGRDLRGAILDGAILTKADLTGADLTGANLRHAVLFEAVLRGAKLASADLTRANLARADLASADLSRAILEETFFEGAVLTEAVLTEAKGRYAVFAEADLSGAKADRAELPNANLTEATLVGADLRGAVLHESIFERTRAEGVDLGGADVSRSSFAGADLGGARLGGATGEQATFFEANLDRAQLDLARLRAAHFTKASLVSASLYGADLRGARFYRAVLDRADFTRANLYQADLCKARLEGTTMRAATLYEAKLLGARGTGLDLSGAVVTRVVRDAR